jgi:hypothetical protein
MANPARSLLPLTSIVPPATLIINAGLRSKVDYAPVPSLDMYSSGQPHRFAVWATTDTTSAEEIQFLGPRTILTRLLTATATLGEILPISHSIANITYALNFFGPSVRCTVANSSIATIIDSIRDADVRNTTVGSIMEHSNYYYSFVPDLTNAGNSSLPYNGVAAVSQNRIETPQNASNQLWVAFSRYTGSLNSDGLRATEDHYLVCSLWNSSYSLSLNLTEGSQVITDTGTEDLNEVQYPNGITPSSNGTLEQYAYSAVFWAMTDLLVGSMGLFLQNTTPPTNFTLITTAIEDTSLLGSQDLSPFFDSNHPTTLTDSDQRLQDISLAQNRTLDVLIEELAFNTTATFMSSNLLSSVPSAVCYLPN